MPRSPGQTRSIDDAWRKRVEDRLAEKGWSRADLAREAHVSRSTISDVLNGRTNELVALDRIHKALGWQLPMPPILSQDASELFGIWEHLDEFERGRLLERARSIYEQQLIGRESPPPKRSKSRTS